MYVCLCNGVTERDIAEAIEAGAATVEEVAFCTGAGTRCGTCTHRVAEMVEGGAPRCEGRPSGRHLHVLTSAA